MRVRVQVVDTTAITFRSVTLLTSMLASLEVALFVPTPLPVGSRDGFVG